MVFRSDKFNTGRKRVSITGEQKRRLSFTKFIKRADKKISSDPSYDMVADFEFYDINCDNCLEKHKKVSSLYIMETDELKRRLAKGELISAEADLFVKCPNCFQVKRVSDIRKLTSGGTIPTIDQLAGSGHVGSSTSDRNPLPIELFSNEVKQEYYNLMRYKDDPNTNQKYIKELENYIKNHAAIIKQFKGTPFQRDYENLINQGKTIIKIENI